MQKLDHVGLGLEVGEQRANASILRGVHVADKVGLPANDQLVAQSPAARPRDEASFHEAGGDLVELLAGFVRGSISAVTSERVRPRMRALRKLLASTSAEAGMPGGVATTRFSIEPSSETRIAIAGRPRDGRIRRASSAHRSCSSARRPRRESIRTTGRSSQRARLRTRLPPPPPAPGYRYAPAPRGPDPRNSSSASTNSLKPCWVGIRPALACGA